MKYKLRFAYCFTLLFLFSLQFQTHIARCQSGVEFYTEGEKYGLKDSQDKILIPATYNKLGWSQGLNLPVDEVIGYYQHSWGLISTSNKVILAPRFYSLEAVHKNLIIASVKGKFSNELFYGAINTRGNVIIDFKYHSLTPMGDLIIVSERRKGKSCYGLLSSQNQVLLPLEFKHITYFKDNLFVFTDWHNKKGLILKSGIVQIPASLDSIAPANEVHSFIFNSGKVGAIDSLGQVILQPEFKKITADLQTTAFPHYRVFDASHRLLKALDCDSLFEISEDLLVVARNDFFEILDENFELVYRSASLRNVSAFRKNILFQKDGKYHIVKPDGHPVIADGFDSLHFDDNYIYGSYKQHWRVFNKFGSNISVLKFEDLKGGSNNLIPVKMNRYWGYIDHSGRTAISPKFDEAGPFVGHMARVNYHGSQRILNPFGDFIGGSDFSKIVIENNNTALATQHGRTDLIDHKGQVLFQTYNQLVPHPLGYLEQTDNGQQGLISPHGEVILYPVYDELVSSPDLKYIIARQGQAMGLANGKGFWILPISEAYQEICHVSEGLIGIKKNGQYGYVDFGRRLLIANRYESIQPFSEGLASVRLNGKWGFIDQKERLVIQPTYNHTWAFRHALALVYRNGKYGAIDPSGNEKIKIEFDTIQTTTHDYLLVTREGKSGLYNQSGEQLLEPSYTIIQPTQDGGYLVQRRGLMGLIDASGYYSIPLKYEEIVEISQGRYICKDTDSGRPN